MKSKPYLKPCPFCGGETIHKIKIVNFFECKECGACTSFVGKGKLEPDTPVEYYNRRVNRGYN